MGVNIMFTLLKQFGIDDIKVKYTAYKQDIKTEEGFRDISRWFGKTYKKNPQQKLLKFLEKKEAEEINKITHQLDEVSNAEDFRNEFVITIEWVYSRTWGYNPKAYTSTGCEYKSISGCGYDKLSTATARALNDNLSILKLIYQKKETALKELLKQSGPLDLKNGLNVSALGYGSGYGIIPYFEGGVGISSHEIILNSIGLIFKHVSHTNNSDTYIIKISPEATDLIKNNLKPF